MAFPSYRDFGACNSLNTADVDAAVFTSGVSATSERHDCQGEAHPAMIALFQLTRASPLTVRSATLGGGLLMVLKSILTKLFVLNPLNLPLPSHGSYRLLGAWFCSRSFITKWALQLFGVECGSHCA